MYYFHILSDIKGAIEHLSLVRGQRRARTLGARDLLGALRAASRNGYGLRAAPTSTARKARRMRLAAIRLWDGDFAILADWGPANPGTSPSPLKPQALAACRRNLSTSQAPWLVLRGSEVERALA